MLYSLLWPIVWFMFLPDGWVSGSLQSPVLVHSSTPESRKRRSRPTLVRGGNLGINPTIDGVFRYTQMGSHVCNTDPTFFRRYVLLNPYQENLQFAMKI